jgi:propanol-preferring alcohol dehydrogenase
MRSAMNASHVEIPTHCKAGVVVNEGPNFHLELQMVPVPEPGKILALDGNSRLLNI